MSKVTFQTAGQALIIHSSTVGLYTDATLETSATLPLTILADTDLYAADSALIPFADIVVKQPDGTILGDRGYFRVPLNGSEVAYTPQPSASQLAVDTTTGWDDLRVSLARATTGASNPSLTAFQGTTQAYAFAKTATNQLFFDVQLPHTWLAGTEIRPHIHWSPGASASTGKVRWQLEHTWGPVNGVFPSSTVMTAVDQAGAGAYKHQICGLGAIAGTGKGQSSVLMCRIARLGGATEDDFDDVAFGLSIDFHIQVSGHGSLDEYPS